MNNRIREKVKEKREKEMKQKGVGWEKKKKTIDKYTAKEKLKERGRRKQNKVSTF